MSAVDRQLCPETGKQCPGVGCVGPLIVTEIDVDGELAYRTPPNCTLSLSTEAFVNTPILRTNPEALSDRVTHLALMKYFRMAILEPQTLVVEARLSSRRIPGSNTQATFRFCDDFQPPTHII